MRTMVLVPLLALACGASAATEPTAAAVSTADPLSTRVGLEILAAGGNAADAADAAVAVGFALAVVYPSAGNIGGGGFAVTFDPGLGLATALDFRETAPAVATRDMYLDAEGIVVPGRSQNGPLAVGVPGSVAGMSALQCEARLPALAGPPTPGDPPRTRRVRGLGGVRRGAESESRAPRQAFHHQEALREA